jgi:hypothetical protein
MNEDVSKRFHPPCSMVQLPGKNMYKTSYWPQPVALMVLQNSTTVYFQACTEKRYSYAPNLGPILLSQPVNLIQSNPGQLTTLHQQVCKGPAMVSSTLRTRLGIHHTQTAYLVLQNRLSQLGRRHPNLVLLRRRVIRHNNLAVVIVVASRRNSSILRVRLLDQLGRSPGQQAVDITLHKRVSRAVPVEGALDAVPHGQHGLHVAGEV